MDNFREKFKSGLKIANSPIKSLYDLKFKKRQQPNDCVHFNQDGKLTRNIKVYQFILKSDADKNAYVKATEDKFNHVDDSGNYSKIG